MKCLLPKPMSVFNSMSSMVSHQGRNAFSASVRSKRDLRTSPSSAAIAMMESLLAFTTIVFGVFNYHLSLCGALHSEKYTKLFSQQTWYYVLWAYFLPFYTGKRSKVRRGLKITSKVQLRADPAFLNTIAHI